MIGSLRGMVLDRSLRNDHQVEFLVEVAGVGYRVLVPGGRGSPRRATGWTDLPARPHPRPGGCLVLYGFPTKRGA